MGVSAFAQVDMPMRLGVSNYPALCQGRHAHVHRRARQESGTLMHMGMRAMAMPACGWHAHAHGHASSMTYLKFFQFFLQIWMTLLLLDDLLIFYN